MATVYLMFPFGSATLDMTGGKDGGGTVGSIYSADATKKITIPNLTYTGAWTYQKFTRTKNELVHMTIGTYGKSTQTSWSGYASEWKSTTPSYTLASVPAGGIEVTCKYNASVGSMTYDPAYVNHTYHVTWSVEAWLCLGVTLPTRSSILYASQVNALAKILNTSTTSAGTAIKRTVCQNIGTAINTKGFSTWNKVNGSAASNLTAVTFDSTKPLGANFDLCVTRLTDAYVYR